MKDIINSFDEPAKVIARADAPEEIIYGLTFKEAFTGYFRTHFSKQYFIRMLQETFPVAKDPVKEKIRKIIRFVSLLLLVAGLSYFVFYYHGYRERIEIFNDLQTAIEKLDEDSMPEFEIRHMWNNIKQQYPDVVFPEGMSIKFASIYAVNQDAVGALSIPEKSLWVPLLQSKNEPNYYLWKDMYGEYNRYGNPYVDYRADMSKNGLSKNTIIYGHNTHDKLGFNVLTTYMTVEGYNEAPVVTLETLYEKTKWKIFGVILTNSGSAQDRGHLFNYLITDFSSEDDFMTMIDGIYERSMINTGVDVNKEDKIISLYTCYQDIFKGGRLVVFARQVREGENAEVDTSAVTFNNSARYPQLYYDNLGLTNPYEKFTTPYLGEAASAAATTEAKTTSAGKNNSSSNKKPGSAANKPAATTRPAENTTAVPAASEKVPETTAPVRTEQPTAATPSEPAATVSSSVG